MSLRAPDGESPATTTSEAFTLRIAPALNGYLVPTGPGPKTQPSLNVSRFLLHNVPVCFSNG